MIDSSVQQRTPCCGESPINAEMIKLLFISFGSYIATH